MFSAFTPLHSRTDADAAAAVRWLHEHSGTVRSLLRPLLGVTTNAHSPPMSAHCQILLCSDDIGLRLAVRRRSITSPGL